MPDNAALVVYLSFKPGYTSAYLHKKTGQGRSARRSLVDCVHVPELASGNITNVLEAVAAELRLPPSERWQPPLPGLGSPVGRWGAP